MRDGITEADSSTVPAALLLITSPLPIRQSVFRSATGRTMTRLFCGTPDSEQMFRTERQLFWEENHVIFRQNPAGNCRNPGEIGRERGCIVQGIALFCQNTVLFFQNHINKFRTPRFIARHGKPSARYPNRPRNGPVITK